MMKPDTFHSATIPKSRLLPGIHGLRGFASVSVVLYHLNKLTGISMPEAFQFIGRDFGYCAHLFLVLSAFSLMYSTEHTIDRQGWAKEYAIKRFFRIAPLFYAMIVFDLTRQAVNSSVLESGPIIFLNLFFVFGFVPWSGFVWGGWTIGVEMIFYVLFPVLLLVIRTTRDALIFLLAAVLISYVSRYELHEQFLNTVPRAKWDWSYFTFLPNLYFFAVGVFAYKFEKRLSGNSETLRVVVPLTAVVTFSILLFTEIDKPLKDGGRLDLIAWAFAIGALCVWQSTRPSRWSANKLFEYLGERSYSIYLLHPVVITLSKPQIIKLNE